MGLPRQITATVALALGLLWGLSEVLPRGLAGGADHVIQGYLDARRTKDASNWKDARHFHIAAETFGPHLPEVLEHGSLMYRWGARVDPSSRQDRLKAALDLQREAVRARPAWPYGWYELLRTKQELGEWDGELDLAFSRTLELGRREPLLQEAMASFAFGYWRLISVEQREGLFAMAREALVGHPEGIFRAARNTASELVLCSRLSDIERVRRYCDEQGLN